MPPSISNRAYDQEILKKIRLILPIVLVLVLSAFGNQALEGEYKNQGNGIYSAVEFKGKSTVVIKNLGMSFPASYERDGDLIRVKSDVSNLLFTVKDSKTLVGGGFSEGVYKKN